MEHQTGISSLVTSAVALTLILFLASPGFRSFSNKFRPSRSNDHNKFYKVYEDEDGVATEASQKEAFATLPRSLLLVSSVVGTLVSIAGSVVSTLRSNEGWYIESWVTVGSWV